MLNGLRSHVGVRQTGRTGGYSNNIIARAKRSAQVLTVLLLNLMFLILLN